MKKKILHIFPTYKIGGIPISILRFIKNSNDIYENYTIGRKDDNSFYDEFNRSSKNAFDVDTTKFNIKSILQILTIVKEINPDIIHVNGKGGALYGFLIRLLTPYKHYKLFYTFHGFYPVYKGLKLKLYLFFEFLFSKLIHRGIAVSTSERNLYLEKIKANRNKITIIPNGIFVKKENLPENIKKIVSKYKINIISLSRVCSQKDLITMLKSFEKLTDKNVALHIMGGYISDNLEQKKYKNKVDKLYSNLKNKENIYFWGDVPNAGNLIHNFDLYWSTPIYEGLPTAIIEAMMSRVLVVGTNCVGNIDLIEDKITGLITDVGDIQDNFDKIKTAIDIIEKDKFSNIVESAYTLSQKFTIENNIILMNELYKD